MNLNGKTINPGELRTSITLQQRTISTDAGGFQVPAWVTVAIVWARWTNMHGNEVWQEQSIQADRPATVLIRYRANLDNTWAVLLGTDRYEIISVDNIQQRSEYMEIKVKMMRAG